MKRVLWNVAWPLVLVAMPSVAAQSTVYEGALYETHGHIGIDGIGPLYVDNQDRNKVTGSVLFMAMDIDDPEGSWKDIRGEFQGKAIQAVLFAAPEGATENLDPDLLEPHFRIGPYKGTGEWQMYSGVWRSLNYSDERWQKHLEWTSRNGHWVMTHPRIDQNQDLAAALERHPDQRFLIHGSVPTPELEQLMRDHRNMFFTIDARAMLCDWSTRGRETGADCLWPDRPGWDRFEAESDRFLAGALQYFRPIIEVAPDRVMWGTDVATMPAADQATYDSIVAFSRRFIGALPFEQQTPFAIGNAMREFGAGEPIPPLQWYEDTPAPGPFPVLAVLALLGVVRVRGFPKN